MTEMFAYSRLVKLQGGRRGSADSPRPDLILITMRVKGSCLGLAFRSPGTSSRGGGRVPERPKARKGTRLGDGARQDAPLIETVRAAPTLGREALNLSKPVNAAFAACLLYRVDALRTGK